MKRTLRKLRYITIVLAAVLVGLVVAKTVETDAETDRFIRETDAFIAAHESKEKTSYGQVKPEAETPKNDAETQKNGEKSRIATVSGEKMTFEANYRQVNTVEDTAVLAPEFFEQINGNSMTPEEFREAGVIFWGMWKFTWYSENVLPGDGLQIPGRWSDGDFVRDSEGYMCVASNDLEQGTVVTTPFGEAKVYDWIGDGVTGVIDIYVSW